MKQRINGKAATSTGTNAGIDPACKEPPDAHPPTLSRKHIEFSLEDFRDTKYIYLGAKR